MKPCSSVCLRETCHLSSTLSSSQMRPIQSVYMRGKFISLLVGFTALSEPEIAIIIISQTQQPCVSTMCIEYSIKTRVYYTYYYTYYIESHRNSVTVGHTIPRQCILQYNTEEK